LRNDSRSLFSLDGCNGQLTSGAAIVSPPMQQSLWKQSRGPRRMQVEMGAADLSWVVTFPKKVQKACINETETWLFFYNRKISQTSIKGSRHS